MDQLDETNQQTIIYIDLTPDSTESPQTPSFNFQDSKHDSRKTLFDLDDDQYLIYKNPIFRRRAQSIKINGGYENTLTFIGRNNIIDENDQSLIQ